MGYRVTAGLRATGLGLITKMSWAWLAAQPGTIQSQSSIVKPLWKSKALPRWNSALIPLSQEVSSA